MGVKVDNLSALSDCNRQIPVQDPVQERLQCAGEKPKNLDKKEMISSRSAWSRFQSLLQKFSCWILQELCNRSAVEKLFNNLTYSFM